jgi:hypothetical protein
MAPTEPSPTALDQWIAQLSGRLGDLECHSVVISDAFGGGEAAQANEQIAFRTVVQLDGEVLTSIHARALADPDFAGAHARHLARVEEVLRAHVRQLERLATAATWGLAALTGGVMYGGGSWFDVVESVADLAYPELVTFGASCVGAALTSVLGRKLLGRLIPRLAGRERARRKDDALAEIAKVATTFESREAA